MCVRVYIVCMDACHILVSCVVCVCRKKGRAMVDRRLVCHSIRVESARSVINPSFVMADPPPTHKIIPNPFMKMIKTST